MVVGDNALSAGSSQPTQSSKEPRSNGVSSLISSSKLSLGRPYRFGWTTVVGDGRVDSAVSVLQESGLGRPYGVCSQRCGDVEKVVFCWSRVVSILDNIM